MNPRPGQNEYGERTLETICYDHLSLEGHSVMSWEELGLRGLLALNSVLSWLLISCDPKRITSPLSFGSLICNSNRNLLCHEASGSWIIHRK